MIQKFGIGLQESFNGIDFYLIRNLLKTFFVYFNDNTE